ncbi:glyco protein hormone beta-5 [Trichinella spiralis]|uniref:glyco protein hormone beta-5 n=1 Tax=Trichinella spiralis TaxID=6334 RepID=UPI0001EFCD00|nr:glyco protein hormone beta-5 [Trichinella spiralis]
MSSSLTCCQQLRTITCNQLRLTLTVLLLLIKYGQALSCPHRIFQKTPGWELQQGCVTVVKIKSYDKYNSFPTNYLETCQQYNNGLEYTFKDLGTVLPEQTAIKDRSRRMKIYLNYNITRQKYSNNNSMVDYSLEGTMDDGNLQRFFRQNNKWISAKKKLIPNEWVNKIGYDTIKPPLCAVYVNNRIDFIECKFGKTFTHVVCIIPKIGKCKPEDEEMKPNGCTECKENLLLPFCYEKREIYSNVNTVNYVTPIIIVSLIGFIFIFKCANDCYLKKKKNELAQFMESVTATTMTSVVSFTPGNKNEE